jgi:hypothetical protein
MKRRNKLTIQKQGDEDGHPNPLQISPKPRSNAISPIPIPASYLPEGRTNLFRDTTAKRQLMKKPR